MINIGKQYNNWTVLKSAGTNNKSQKIWHCQCVCGNKEIKTSGYLNYNTAKGCRCCDKNKRKVEEKQLIASLSGQRIGDWTVIEYVGQNKYKSRLWKCRCKCGAERNFITAYLSGNGKRTATKCKKCELKEMEESNRTTKELPDRIWNKIKHTAIRRNIVFNISQEEALNKFSQQDGKCALTGITLYFTKLRSRYWKYTNASLDRIDSKKPYIIDNIQWVDKRINMMKQKYSQDEFVHLCKLVSENAGGIMIQEPF